MRWAFVLAFGLLAACDVEQGADTLARASAKLYINTVVSNNFPGVNPAPITDCIIDNATTAEAVVIAQAALVGGSADAVTTIGDIAGRPATIGCVAEQTLAGALG